MALSTYAELKASVADWLNRSDLTSAITDFVSLAESQMERDLRTRQMIVRANAYINTEYSALPSDYLEAKSFKLTGTNPISPLVFQSINAMDDLLVNYSASGQPKYFCVIGGQIRVVPTPDTSYLSELIYYAKLSRLSNANTTNWLLTLSPDVYLYGSLLQAAPYLQDDARIQVWAGLYQKGIEALNLADERGSMTGGALKARARTFG
jgi:hypothetical protein